MQRLLATGRIMGILLCAGLASHAQEQPCFHRTVIANVVSKAEVPAGGCDESCFRATVAGERVLIESVNQVSRPARIVVLLDASDSMRSSSKWEMALFVSAILFKNASPASPMALLVFGNDVFGRVGLSVDKHTALQTLQQLKLKSLPKKEKQSAIYDALLEGLAMLGPPEPGDVLYFITDGADTVSRNRLEKVKETLLIAKTRLFGTLLLSSRDNWRGIREREDASPFEEMIRDSGGGSSVFYGSMLSKDSPLYNLTDQYRGMVTSLHRNLLQQANNFYRLEFRLPKAVDKMRNWELDLTSRPGLDKKTWHVVYPRKLMPCEQSSSTR
jgi:hypothetical protein